MLGQPAIRAGGGAGFGAWRNRDAPGRGLPAGRVGVPGRPRASRRGRRSAARMVPIGQPSRRLRDGDRSHRRFRRRTLCVGSRARRQSRRLRNADADVQGGRLRRQTGASRRLGEGGTGLVVGRSVDARGRCARGGVPGAPDARFRQHAGTADQGIEIFRSLPRYEGRSRLKTWILGLAYNRCRQTRRSSRTRRARARRLRTEPDEPPGDCPAVLGNTRVVPASTSCSRSVFSPGQRPRAPTEGHEPPASAQ
jgi:hypothetical protein